MGGVAPYRERRSDKDTQEPELRRCEYERVTEVLHRADGIPTSDPGGEMSKLEFSVRPWTSWDDETQEKLLSLTLVIEHGPWAKALSGMNVYCDKYPDALDTWVALLDDEPIGWALRTRTAFEGGKGWSENRTPLEGEAMFYVHPEHRRKGVGRALLDLITRDRGPGIVTPWDDASEGFYRLAKGWDLRREDC